MYSDLSNAMNLLAAGGYTCVLCRGSMVITDTRRGIRPLLEFWENGQDLQGAAAADKVVGKAAAMLYCLLGICAVHARVLSRPAEEMLCRHGIHVTYDRLVDAIHNRSGDGFCPMETAVWELEDPSLAPDVLHATLKALATP